MSDDPEMIINGRRIPTWQVYGIGVIAVVPWIYGVGNIAWLLASLLAQAI